MRRIANYIRQIFCKHDFEIAEKYVTTYEQDGVKVNMRCKKCGYHTNYWKFL